MWSLEDLEALNPADSRQDVSFLRHVLGICAASEDSLCNAATQLEAREGPYVVAFAQLPFMIDASAQNFKVHGWREGVVVELKFTQVNRLHVADTQQQVAASRRLLRAGQLQR